MLLHYSWLMCFGNFFFGGWVAQGLSTYIALGVLELNMLTSLASNSDLCCLPLHSPPCNLSVPPCPAFLKHFDNVTFMFSFLLSGVILTFYLIQTMHVPT